MPSVAIDLSPSGSVDEGTAIAVTMSFSGLESDSDPGTTDYTFRADVVGADACEEPANGYGLGVQRKINKVDEDPETRGGTISADCPAGDYTVRASIPDAGGAELASASASFGIAAPEPELSTDATLSSLALSGVTLEFDPAATTYAAEVGNGLAEATVTPTVNDDGATYAVRLAGAADEDGIIQLAVGENSISVVVTAEDGETTRTYTVTVTRAEPPTAGRTVSIGLSPDEPTGVAEGTAISVTMSFGNLAEDSDRDTTDYIFRGDVKNSANGNADGCEDQASGYGLGINRTINQVDEDPETRAGTISANCPPGDYTLTASISDSGGAELASASASFSIAAPEPELSSDAALSSLTLSGVTLSFDSDITHYTADVANDAAETTVTPTVNHGGATYAVKLDGVTDDDGVIPLAVGENVITIEVTVENGNTARIYTVTVTRAESPEPTAAIDLSPSGSVDEGTEIAVTISFGGLAFESDPGTTDYTFRADVLNADDQDADGCEGHRTGVDRYMYQVDEDPEVRAAIISAGCPPGDYTLRASISSSGNTEPASATANFTIGAVTTPEPTPEPAVGPTPEPEQATGPTAAISLEPAAFVYEGEEIAVAMSFGGLTFDSDRSTIDYIFRADVQGAEARDAGPCEGKGIGFNRYAYQVDEDPEVRAGTIPAGCPQGAYTLRVSVASAANEELTSASVPFFVLPPPTLQIVASVVPQEEPLVSSQQKGQPTGSYADRQPRITSAVYNSAQNSVVLTWAAPNQCDGLRGFRIERMAPRGETEETHADLWDNPEGTDNRPRVDAGELTYTDTNIPATWLILYSVFAIDGGGRETASPTFLLDRDYLGPAERSVTGRLQYRGRAHGTRLTVTWVDDSCMDSYYVGQYLSLLGTTQIVNHGGPLPVTTKKFVIDYRNSLHLTVPKPKPR